MKSFIEQWNNDAPTIWVSTSGSTGTPKLIEVEKEKMRNSARMTCDFLNLQNGDTALLCLPLQYISGKMMVVRALEKGLKLIQGQNNTKPLQQLNQPIDFAAMTPLQVANSLDQLHFIKKLIIGGASISDTLQKKIQYVLKESQQPHWVYETYGMSETLSHIALRQIYPTENDYLEPLDGVHLELDHRNCLRINAPHLCEQPIQTNDIVIFNSTHQFKLIGRADFVINSAGLKIYPEILENQFKKNTDKELIFSYLEDDLLGQKLILIIEGENDENLLDQIKNFDFENKNHQPKSIYFIPKLARSENGKLLRLEIRKQLLEQLQ